MKPYRLDLIFCLILILVTVAVFWQLPTHDFVSLDDNIYVYENRHVQKGLTREGFFWAFTTFRAGNWHPLTWLTHMLDCQFSGLNPGRHHLTNLLLHIANSLLLFLVLRRMTGARWRSVFVAALFGLHPLHVESVGRYSTTIKVLKAKIVVLYLQKFILLPVRRSHEPAKIHSFTSTEEP